MNTHISRPSRIRRVINSARAALTRLSAEKMGRIATMISALVALLTFGFGPKFPLLTLSAEHLYKAILPRQQLISKDTNTTICLNTCIITNSGQTPAGDVRVRVYPQPTVPLAGVSVIGGEGEGSWQVISGGKGSDHLILNLKRLPERHPLEVTVMTTSTVDILCDAASNASLALELSKSASLSLTAWDLLILLSVQIGSVVGLALMITRLNRNR